MNDIVKEFKEKVLDNGSYTVTVTETRILEYVIKADNEETAQTIAEDRYTRGWIPEYKEVVKHDVTEVSNLCLTDDSGMLNFLVH